MMVIDLYAKSSSRVLVTVFREGHVLGFSTWSGTPAKLIKDGGHEYSPNFIPDINQENTINLISNESIKMYFWIFNFDELKFQYYIFLPEKRRENLDPEVLKNYKK